ncbi:MAG: M3 family metallopeptidase [Bacteroidales bacterium]|nr:M3 family metallopeptidase [Bacteroidales bacterium]
MTKFTKILLIMTIACTPVAASAQTENPLMQNHWNTPHQTPPFSLIRNEHYKPAMLAAIDEAKANIKKIKSQKANPTFENTIVAMQTASEKLERISNILFNLNECNTSPELQQIVMDILPELTRFENSVSMDEKLFMRVKAVYDQRDQLSLTTEQRTLLENTYKGFVRNGVNLTGKDRKTYAKNSERLSQLSQMMNQNVLADNNEYTLHITNAEDLSGLPANVIAAASAEAKGEGWTFTLAYPSYGPFLTFADNRGLREQIWKAYNSRGNRGNENDNNEIIREMTYLRYQQAKLLGYANYSEYVLSDRMCETPLQLNDFFGQLLQASTPFAIKDLKAVSNFAASHGAELPLQRWDFSYWSEKLKQEQYGFDAEVLRPYFQLEKVRQGIFDLYGRLYGLSFRQAEGIEVYHPDVVVFEVYRQDRFMGVLYLDMHPRASKRSGAWMTEFRPQSDIDGKQIRPLIQVVCNFSKPVGNTPALLSFDEVETFMHEFGHAMHGMLTDCVYPSISGTSVKRDFVELPSQVMENWCYEPQFLNTFARHYQTGDTIPGEYIRKIKAAEKYLAGWLCSRQLSLGLADFAFHTINKPIEGPIEDFERQYMRELLPPVQGCNTSTAFTHIFAGGYASGYYGYKWAEVLDADVFSEFKKNGIFDQATAERFLNEILSKGGSEHPAILFRNFMGRDPNINALLIRCGFAEEIKTAFEK